MNPRRPARHAAMLAAALTLASVPVVVWAADPTSTSSGAIRFFKGTSPAFDRFTDAPTPEQQQWMQTHYWRMLTYSPYFDTRLVWFPNAWVYEDLYAIYSDSPLVQQHPEWILRDPAGNPLYIPYACAGGTCPQYAGDVGSPAFRAHWISDAAATLPNGYRGLFVDDVNMRLAAVGDGSGRAVTPLDPRTGLPMTESDWRRYIAEFTEQIRAAFPHAEIVHNALWFLGHDDPFLQRELLSADFVDLERGVNDDGLRGGGGTFGLETFFSYIDWLHGAGRSVVFIAGAATDAAREYGLAGYFLINATSDGLGNDPGGAPDDWWAGYDVDLGEARGLRQFWSGLIRRDFERGLVLLNEPEAPAQTIRLDHPYTNVAGQEVSSITLGPAEGAVLRGVPTLATSTTTSTTTASTSSTSTTSVTSVTSTTLTPPPCRSAPETGCQPGRGPGSSLLLTKGSTPAKNRLRWKWVGSGAVNEEAFGDPTATTDYVVCLYTPVGLELAARVPAGRGCSAKRCWTPRASTGFRYRNKQGRPDGVTSIVLKAGAAGAARIAVKGKGASLRLPTLPLAISVRVQLQRADTDGCWEAVYSQPSANTAVQFQAHSRSR